MQGRGRASARASSKTSPVKHAAAKLQQSVAAAAGGMSIGPRVQQERQLWMQLIEMLRKRCVVMQGTIDLDSC